MRKRVHARRLEDFIQDWYWDEPSHKFARKLGTFLLQFLDHLKQEGLSPRTINVHSRNCWCIGKFECDYGDTKRFSYQQLFSSPGAHHVFQFERKLSDAKRAVASYRVTWRRLYKYTNELTSCSGDE